MATLLGGKLGRRLFHAIGGSILPILGLLLPREPLLIFLGVVAFLFVVVEVLRLLVPAVNQWLMSAVSPASRAFKERESARPIGATFLVVGGFLSYLFFPRDVAVAALFFSAFGDPAAATVGGQFGRTRIGSKSLEGTLAFVVVALVVGAILIFAGLRLTWLTIVVGALVAALVELLPVPVVDDNLTIPLIAGLAMALVR